MTDRLIDKYTKRPSPEGEVPDADPGEAENLGCFGWLRGTRDRAIMLELRRKDSHVLAVGYAWLEQVEFEPSAGITLHLPGRKIRLEGSGLNSEARPSLRLFDGIIRHRVPWIREADHSERLQPDRPVIVERIRWDL